MKTLFRQPGFWRGLAGDACALGGCGLLLAGTARLSTTAAILLGGLILLACAAALGRKP